MYLNHREVASCMLFELCPSEHFLETIQHIWPEAVLLEKWFRKLFKLRPVMKIQPRSKSCMPLKHSGSTVGKWVNFMSICLCRKNPECFFLKIIGENKMETFLFFRPQITIAQTTVMGSSKRPGLLSRAFHLLKRPGIMYTHFPTVETKWFVGLIY